MPGIGIGIDIGHGGGVDPNLANNPLVVMAANTVAWWRGDMGITIGTGVSQWSDQSGNGVHLTQGTGANQAVFNATGGPNSTPSLLFDGVNDSLINAALDRPAPGTQPTFVWAVLRQIGAGWTAGDRFWSFGSVNGFAVHQLTASPGIALRNTNVGTVNNALAVNTYGRIEAYCANAAADYLKLIATSVTGILGNADPAAGFTLGAAQGGTNFGNCEISEVAIFSALPSAGQLATLDAYCTARYGPGLV